MVWLSVTTLNGVFLSNDDLILLFTAAIFLTSLLTFKVVSFPVVKYLSSTNKIKILSFTNVTYRKKSQKIVAPHRNWKATIF